MDDPVEYGVGFCRLSDAIMPFGDGILAGNDCRLQSVSVFHDFQEVAALIFGQWVHGLVVNDEEVRLCKSSEDLEETAVSFCDPQFLKESC